MVEKYSHCPHIPDEEMKALPKVGDWIHKSRAQVRVWDWKCALEGALTWAVRDHQEGACSMRREESQGLSPCKVLFQHLPLTA